MLNSTYVFLFTIESLEDTPVCKNNKHKADLRDIQITQETVLKNLNQINPTESPALDGLYARSGVTNFGQRS